MKEKIIKAAVKIFSEKGYAETRMVDIAREAGISPGAIYQYFTGKKELFDSLNLPELEKLKPGFQRRKEEILNTAVELFGQRGFAGTTMDDIANGMGVSKAALYQYFSSKEEIISSIIEESHLSIFANISSQFDHRDSLEKIMAQIGMEFARMFSPTRLNLFRTLMAEAGRFPEAGKFVHKNAVIKGTKRISLFLEEKKQAGELADVDTFFVSRAFFGMIFMFFVFDKILNPEYRMYSEEEIIDKAVGLFLNGVTNSWEKPETKRKSGREKE